MPVCVQGLGTFIYTSLLTFKTLRVNPGNPYNIVHSQHIWSGFKPCWGRERELLEDLQLDGETWLSGPFMDEGGPQRVEGEDRGRRLR